MSPLRTKVRPTRLSTAAFDRRVAEAKRRIGPAVTDMDPGDVDLIVRSVLRPFGTGRRFFLRQIRPGVYVF